MKKFTVAVFLLLAACASGPDAKSAVDRNTASIPEKSSAEIIFSALTSIDEKDARPVNEYGMPSLGAEIVEKSIGGLSCKRTTVVSPNSDSKFNCSLGTPMIPQKIYEALNVEEKDVRPRTKEGFVIDSGATMMEKSVGSLACRKTTPPARVSTYDCEMRN